MHARLPQTVSALQAAGISYSGAWQLAQAQVLTDAKDRRRLTQVLAAMLTSTKAVSAPASNGSSIQTRSGIKFEIEDVEA